MNFLEIAKRVRQECGIAGDGPSAVTGQDGINAKIVNWVGSAYEELQTMRPWRFNWATHTQALTAGVNAYDPHADWGLDFRQLAYEPIYVYRTADGPNSRQWLSEVPWEVLREMPYPSGDGFPAYVAIRPLRQVTQRRPI